MPVSPSGQKSNFQIDARFQASIHTGPIPHPDLLIKYDQLLPGSVERIFNQVEIQSAHRQEMERVAVTGEDARKTHGQIFAFIIILVAFAISFTLILLGKSTEGFATVIVAMVGLTGLFITGKYLEHRKTKPAPTA